MEIITGTDFSYERLYCPSTGEVIMGPILDEIVIEPKAVIAQWDYEFIEEPTIYNPSLEKAWNRFYLKFVAARIHPRMIEKFLAEYDNPDWKVYECELEGMGCGPISRTILYVVKADTIVEEHPYFVEEDSMPPGDEPNEEREEKKSTTNHITDDELIKNIMESSRKEYRRYL